MKSGGPGGCSAEAVVAPLLLFACGFFPGLYASAIMSPLRFRAVGRAVLFSPIAALILLRYPAVL